MNKEELKNMLKAMSKEDLLEVIVEMQTEEEDSDIHSIDKTKNNRRRGKGHRKKKGRSTRSRSTKEFGTGKGNKARSGRLDTSGNRPNKFEDFMENTVFSGSERQELEQAGAEDKANSEVKKSPRSRTSPMVEVCCMICEKEESVSAVLINDISRYTCNNCCTRR